MPKKADFQKPFAKKSFGQNFLVDENFIHKIVDALLLKSDETVVEIGAGRGALTEKLITKAGKVVAIEFDRDLIPELWLRFGEKENFKLVDADALHVDFTRLSANGKRMRLVANLPYNISTAILQRLMDQRNAFSGLVLMFQREVVERITATESSKERGFLTVLTELYFEVERLFDVPPNAFRPAPKVWSSVVRLSPKDVDMDDEAGFRRLISTAFAQKRKTIANNLKHEFKNYIDALKNAGIAENRRAETLNIEEWIRLHRSISPSG